MNKKIVFGLFLLLLSAGCQQDKKKHYDLLIINATILDVRLGQADSGQLIGISGDTIKVIDDSANKEAYRAEKIMDATGKFIIPGLWDMHVHFRGGDSLINENKNLLPLFLAYGVTTVRDAGGDITPGVLTWREQIRNGQLAGPTIFTSGPKLDGADPAWNGSIRVTNEDQVEMSLDSLQVIGADYVKMYDGSLTKESFYAIIEAAEKRGLKTTGHMPLSANILEAIDLGLDGTEHMYYVLKACSPLEDSLTRLNIGYRMMEPIVDTYDTLLADQVFEEMTTHNVFITPTLYIGKTLAEILDTNHQEDTLLSMIGAGIIETYQGRVESAKKARAGGNTMRDKMEKLSRQVIPRMYEAGVSMVAGSDCGAYVIMTNHVHCILRSKNGHLSDVVRDFKKHPSKLILKEIESNPTERAGRSGWK